MERNHRCAYCRQPYTKAGLSRHLTEGAHPKRRDKAKEKAQEMLMDGIATVLGYWSERNNGDLETALALGFTEEEFQPILQRQADRVARLLGYEYAWNN